MIDAPALDGEMRVQTGVTCTPVYQASQFGGDVLFTATSLDASNATSTATLTVAMPNLDLLPDATYYDKTGGTCDHPGPNARGLPAACTAPDDNHYVYSSPVDPNDPNSNPSLQLQRAAQAFLDATGSKMRLNDMSLPDGGGFDIKGAWFLTTSQTVDCKSSGGHCWHRLGKSVDIENAGPTNLIKLKKFLQPPNGNWIFVNEGKSVFPHFQWGGEER